MAANPSVSRRPYLIRAIHDWALDNNYTPYLLVAADEPGVTVPRAFVRDGRIALDVGPMAVRDLNLDSDPIFFSARFGGVAHDLLIPARAVLAVYARETSEGIVFGEPEPAPEGEAAGASAAAAAPATPPVRPVLREVGGSRSSVEPREPAPEVEASADGSTSSGEPEPEGPQPPRPSGRPSLRVVK